MSSVYNEEEIREALLISWSLETAVQWTQENPASGQCNVTAAVVYDLFGGEILRTRLPGVWHYYNRLGGSVVDFTDSQFFAPGALFEAPEHYDHELTTRCSAMTNIPQKEYETLKRSLLAALESRRK